MKRKILASILAFSILAVGCNKVEKTENTENKATQTEAQEVKAVAKDKIFVTPAWVKSVMDGKQEESKDYVVLEASWGPLEAAKNYTEGHIPGALHINTDEIESEELWNLRPAEDVKNAFLSYGITKDTTLIVYGEDSAPARIAFTALWLGVENVKVMDGGMDAWKEMGYDVSTEVPEKTAKTDFGTAVPVHPEYVIGIDEVKDKLANDKNFKLVSIRTLDEFTGKTSGYTYIEKMGEPKGALWGHDELDYYDSYGSFIGIEKAQSIWKEQEVEKGNEIAFYCGTGWRASIPWLIAHENGWNVKLFDGGWFEWQKDASNPVQSISPEEALANSK